ncbi:ABC transporter permease [Shewanella dokdonensis]|uniref:ABC transporter permease n=1 Tax=Shewanella dokdonensis TaxID=712036 RepID=A0ABX8DBY4_9GAMM|nr:ABC transporter permease [Shewanella dokdonensis]MCL1074700.1 ABC transporter permease [Shewanella dokdonensis]QVK22319.1 ABC transporter permease [Shewanella dokdonensis]
MLTPLPKLSYGQWLGAAILSLLLLSAWLVPLLGHHQPNVQHLQHSFAPISTALPLGSDQFGRDMLARLAAAVRLSFGLSLLCVTSSALIGVAAGVIAAWGGRRLDALINFIANTVMALPGLVLVLLIAGIAPGSFAMLYLGISLTLWVEYFRVVRASVQPLLQGPELQSSLMLGFSRWYLFRRHIWPAIASNVLTLAAFGAATSVLMMASTGFVYAGLKPPTAELGLMIVELFPYFSEASWVLLQPLCVLLLMVLGFNLLAGQKA